MSGFCLGALLAGLCATGCDQAQDVVVDDPGAATSFRCAPTTLPGVGGLELVELSGSASITSPDATFDLFSNGTMSITGLANVGGGLSAQPKAITLANTATVTGDVASWTPTVPTYMPTSEVAYVQANQHNADIGLSLNGIAPIDGDDTLSLFGSDSLQLPGWYYALDDLKLSGDSTLSLSYQVTYIVVDGEVNISGGSELGTTRAAHILLISTSSEPIVISGAGTNVIARIYAPLAPVTISDGASVEGSVVGRTLQMSGTATMEVTQDGLHIWHPC